MAGKVFISCGQANDNEINVAKQLEKWLAHEGFDPYVAIQTQSIYDVNSGIIANLVNSDYYIYINFKREKISENNFRGSLFTNQELAIAYYLKFDYTIFFEQKGVLREGILNYITANSIQFIDYNDIVDLVKNAVTIRKWSPKYSRHLKAGNLSWTQKEIGYNDGFGNSYEGKVLNLEIINQRKDIPSYKTQIRLEYLDSEGKTTNESIHKSPIKCEGQPYYEQTIWPDSSGSFSLLLQDKKEPRKLHLISSADITPKPPLIETLGIFDLYLSVLAQNFPILDIMIEINNSGDYVNELKTRIINGA